MPEAKRPKRKTSEAKKRNAESVRVRTQQTKVSDWLLVIGEKLVNLKAARQMLSWAVWLVSN